LSRHVRNSPGVRQNHREESEKKTVAKLPCPHKWPHFIGGHSTSPGHVFQGAQIAPKNGLFQQSETVNSRLLAFRGIGVFRFPNIF
jgi:hypothetical protein